MNELGVGMGLRLFFKIARGNIHESHWSLIYLLILINKLGPELGYAAFDIVKGIHGEEANR